MLVLVLVIVIVLECRLGNMVRNRSIVIGALLIIAATAVVIALWASSSPGPLFADTTAITFNELGFDEPDKSFTVTDQAEIRRIIGTIRLRTKRPCACAHRHQATFQKTTGTVRVSFCGHCFDVLVAPMSGSYKDAKFYRMPKAFYAEFRGLALRRANEDWRVEQ